jgi:hypothetical protein
MKADLAFALLSPEQVRSICAQGGRVELSFAYVQEGAYPFRRCLIFLDQPSAVTAFLEALFNKGAVLGPAMNQGGVSVAQKLFVCGFVNHENGSILINSIHIRNSSCHSAAFP